MSQWHTAAIKGQKTKVHHCLVCPCSCVFMYICYMSCMDVHLWVKIVLKLKEMRAALRICFWELKLKQAYSMCMFNYLLSLLNKAGTTLSLMINISLLYTPPPPLCFPPHPPSLPHPPIIPLCPSSCVDERWYSRGIVEEESFPGPVTSSSQIKQGTCSDHLTLGSLMKPSDRNWGMTSLFTHSLCLQCNAVLHTITLPASFTYFTFHVTLICVFFYVFVLLLKSINAEIYNQTKVLHKIN